MIAETTTVAELRLMPAAEVIAALFPNPTPAVSRRYGPFGNLWFRPMDLPTVGSVIPGHKHKYDHVTFLSKGSIKVIYTLPTGETGEKQFKAPATICIKKNVLHEIIALEDNTRADCIYALRDMLTGEVIEHWDGDMEAYK